MRRWPAVLCVLCAPADALAQDVADASPDCATVEACVAVVREREVAPPPASNQVLSSGIDARPIARAMERLGAFGDAGVVALLPLLEHASFNVRKRAGYALRRFEQINARHAPQLIEAHRDGVPWLETPIARTGTDEALEYLWAAFLAEPSYGSNAQAFTALSHFGERLFPLLENELVRCQSSADHRLCSGLFDLLRRQEPLPAFALPLIEAIATSPEASPEALALAESELIGRRHPRGLTVLIGALETYAGAAAEARESVIAHHTNQWGVSVDGDLARMIDSVAAYGEDAQAAGALLELFLDARGWPDARAAAALALGRIGYHDGVDAILARSGDFGDDWFLAYNAAESLARLGAGHETLDVLAHEHWYKPVRNNAERGLNLLDGGAFERPGVEGDGAAPPEESNWPLTGADVRYAGDVEDTPRSCTIGRERRYAQLGVDDVRWPRAPRSDFDETDAELVPRAPTAAERRRFSRDFPALAREDQRPLVFAAELGSSVIAGTSYGEWGGAVYAIEGRRARRLIDSNAVAAFRSDDRLFVVTGLSHLVMSVGDLWVIELDGRRPIVSRRIRLPLEPHRFEAAYREVLVVGSERGDVAIRADGTLVDPQRIESCSS